MEPASKFRQTDQSDSVLRAIESMRQIKPIGDFINADDLNATIEKARSCLADDLATLTGVRSMLYDADIANYGPAVSKLFQKWEDEGGSPSLLALVVHAVDFFGLDPEHALIQGAYVAALLAEYPNALQYHGNLHYRKVLFHAIRMIATHNHLHRGREHVLIPYHIGLILVASCIHDLGHQGGDNLRDGVYTPGAMELRALEIATPYLRAAGMDSETMGDIETAVFCTDITFFAGDNSPCIRMKNIYKHFFWEDYGEDVSMLIIGRLRRFDHNPILVLIAMILHEADVATSAGLSYEQTIRETISLMGERGITNPGPKTVLNFLREQLGETMFTQAGKQLFGKVMADVIARAEADIAAGRLNF